MKTLMMVTAVLAHTIPLPSTACAGADRGPCDQVAASFERMLTHEPTVLTRAAARAGDDDPLLAYIAVLWDDKLSVCQAPDAIGRAHSAD